MARTLGINLAKAAMFSSVLSRSLSNAPSSPRAAIICGPDSKPNWRSSFCKSCDGLIRAIMAERSEVAASAGFTPEMVSVTIMAFSSSRLTPNSDDTAVTRPSTEASSSPRTRPTWIVAKNFAATSSAWLDCMW